MLAFPGGPADSAWVKPGGGKGAGSSGVVRAGVGDEGGSVVGRDAQGRCQGLGDLFGGTAFAGFDLAQSDEGATDLGRQFLLGQVEGPAFALSQALKGRSVSAIESSLRTCAAAFGHHASMCIISQLFWHVYRKLYLFLYRLTRRKRDYILHGPSRWKTSTGDATITAGPSPVHVGVPRSGPYRPALFSSRRLAVGMPGQRCGRRGRACSPAHILDVLDHFVAIQNTLCHDASPVVLCRDCGE